MESGNLDVGTGRLVPGPGPLLAHSGNQPIQLVPIQMNRCELAAEVAKIVERLAARPREMNRTSRAELQERVDADPFVVEGVVSARILEITPSKADERLQFLLARAP